MMAALKEEPNTGCNLDLRLEIICYAQQTILCKEEIKLKTMG